MSGHTVFKWLHQFNERKDYPFKKVENSSTIYCKACEKSFDGFQKIQFSQHSKNGRHKQNMQLKAKRTQTQAQLKDLVKWNPKQSKSEVLGLELCLSSWQPTSPGTSWSIRKFEAFLRKTWPSVCQMSQVWGRIIWLTAIKRSWQISRLIWKAAQCGSAWTRQPMLLETVGNVLVGKLDNDGYTPPYLVNCAYVSRLINNTLCMLLPNFDADLAKIIMSDAAP